MNFIELSGSEFIKKPNDVLMKLLGNSIKAEETKSNKLAKYLKFISNNKSKTVTIFNICPKESSYEKSRNDIDLFLKIDKIKKLNVDIESSDLKSISPNNEDDCIKNTDKRKFEAPKQHPKTFTAIPKLKIQKDETFTSVISDSIRKFDSNKNVKRRNVSQWNNKSKEELEVTYKGRNGRHIKVESRAENPMQNKKRSQVFVEPKTAKGILGKNIMEEQSVAKLPKYLNVEPTEMDKSKMNQELNEILHESEVGFLEETIANLKQELKKTEKKKQDLIKERETRISNISKMAPVLETLMAELKIYRDKYGKINTQ